MPPLLPLVSLATGLWLASLFHPSVTALAIAGTLSVLALRCRPGHWSSPLRVIVLLCGTGLLLHHLALAPQTRTAEWIGTTEGPIRASGRLERFEHRSDGSSFADLQELRVDGDDPGSLRGKLRLFIEANPPSALPGDRVHFFAELHAPRRFGTPGEFDYPRHLAAAGIVATATIPDGGSVAVEPDTESTPPARAMAKWRQSLSAAIADTLPEPESALLQSLLLGQRNQIGKAESDLLAAGGVMHLFAISGLHLALVALLAYRILLFFFRRFPRLLLWQPPARVIPWLILPLLFSYLFLTGAAISTQRAFLLTAVGVLATWQRRQNRPIHLLGCVALLLLLFQPLQLFAPAFQLSFAGTAGLLLVFPRWNRFFLPLPAWQRRPLQALAASGAATVATLPLVFYHFHTWAPAGLLNNLWAIPLIGGVTLPCGLLGLACHGWWPQAAEFCWQLAGWLLSLSLDGLRWVDSLPPLAGRPLYLDPLQLTAICGLAIVILLPSASRFPWKSTLAIGIPLLGCLPYPTPTGLALTTLSVGQGESLLLSNNGAHYLIDGGGLRSSRYDVGERLLAPALARLGIHRLQGVILTHNHPDHRDGLRRILETFPVDALVTAVPPQDLPPDWHTLIQAQSIPLVPLHDGWQSFGAQTSQQIELFVPDQTARNLNDRSLVVHAALGDDGLLLTGDLESAGLGQLLEAGIPAPTTLLKLPHHGSRTSDPGQLLVQCNICEAVASSGWQNSFRQPHPETVDKLEARGIRFWRTDLQGTVQLTSTGSGWENRTWPAVYGR